MDLISYYDLLTMLKDGNIPRYVKRHILHYSKLYEWSEEDTTYLLHESEETDQNFTLYLIESYLDMTTLDKTIEVIEEEK